MRTGRLLPILSLATLVVPGCSGTPPAMGDMASIDGGDKAMNCNPVSQNCDDPQKQCTVTAFDNASGSMSAATSCLAATGTKMEGEACVRPVPDGGGVGVDDCQKGLYCSALGTFPLDQCRRFCTGDGSCGAGKRCVKLTRMPLYALCVPTCMPFGACPNGLNCSWINEDSDGVSIYLGCKQPGTKTAGMECRGDHQCGANLICNPLTPLPTCIPLCDAMHPCAAGVCTQFPGGGGAACI